MRFRAFISSPQGANPVSTSIEFESEHKAGSKQNLQDARFKMLELHGAEAISWQVTDVQRLSDRAPVGATEQLMLDFRDPVEAPKRAKRVKRGITSSGL